MSAAACRVVRAVAVGDVCGVARAAFPFVRTRVCAARACARGFHVQPRLRAAAPPRDPSRAAGRRSVTVWAFRGGATAVGVLGAYVGLLVFARTRFMQRIYLLRSLRASRQKALPAPATVVHLHRPDKLKWCALACEPQRA